MNHLPNTNSTLNGLIASHLVEIDSALSSDLVILRKELRLGWTGGESFEEDKLHSEKRLMANHLAHAGSAPKGLVPSS